MQELLELLSAVPQAIRAADDLIALIRQCFEGQRQPTAEELATAKAKLDADLAEFRKDAGSPSPSPAD